MNFKTFEENLIYNFWTDYCRPPTIREFLDLGGVSTWVNYPTTVYNYGYGYPKKTKVIRLMDLYRNELFIGSSKEVAEEVGTVQSNVNVGVKTGRCIAGQYLVEEVKIDYWNFVEKYKDMYTIWKREPLIPGLL